MYLDIAKKPKDTKIVVAMSGGVDSSTVAAMLVDAGYDVIGMTMQLYDHGQAIMKKNACCAGQDIYDAKMVANKLAIPHYVLNYESRFKQSVMDDFADSYLRGETPIPCVKCNQSVKFHDLLTMAKDLGADALVTGHYVKRVQNGSEIELHKAIDETKDQSYFLFATTKSQLEYTRFPLGNYTKLEIRKLAQKYGLPVADKPDSQDICFVPDGSYAKVVEKLRPGALDSGDIVDLEGNILAKHNGIINFTIGQRKGLGVSGSEPLYVIKIDPNSKQVTIGPKSALLNKTLRIRDVNWLYDEDLSKVSTMVKIRSTQTPVPANIIRLTNNEAKIELLDEGRAITPGQACVMYSDSRVLGGGWVTKEIN